MRVENEICKAIAGAEIGLNHILLIHMQPAEEPSTVQCIDKEGMREADMIGQDQDQIHKTICPDQKDVEPRTLPADGLDAKTDRGDPQGKREIIRQFPCRLVGKKTDGKKIEMRTYTKDIQTQNSQTGKDQINGSCEFQWSGHCA